MMRQSPGLAFDCRSPLSAGAPPMLRPHRGLQLLCFANRRYIIAIVLVGFQIAAVVFAFLMSQTKHALRRRKKTGLLQAVTHMQEVRPAAQTSPWRPAWAAILLRHRAVLHARPAAVHAPEQRAPSSL